MNPTPNQNPAPIIPATPTATNPGPSTPSQSTTKPNSATKSKSKGLFIGLIIYAALAVAGITFGVFGFIFSNHYSSMVDDLKSMIEEKDKTIASLKQLVNSNQNNADTDEPKDERDQQRRRDMARFQSSIFQFQANNNGRLPGQSSDTPIDGQGGLVYQPSQDRTLPSTSDGVAATLITRYLNRVDASENSFIDPDSWTYGLTIIDYDHYKNLPEKSADHMIYLIHQASCNSSTGISNSDKSRDFAILYKLEADNLGYCIDNH